MGHGFRARGRSGTRSLKTWLGQSTPAFGQELTATSGLFSPGQKFFGTPDSQDVTILRTRGSIGFMMIAETTVAAGDSYSCAVGIGLTTAEAALAGAVPLPYENPDWDGWFYYESKVMEPYLGGQSGTGTGYRVTWDLDTKAMRKVQAGNVLFLATQLFTGSGSVQVVNSIINIRTLVKTS